MKSFEILVQRECIEETIVFIEAESEDEARQAAYEMADGGDLDFKMGEWIGDTSLLVLHEETIDE